MHEDKRQKMVLMILEEVLKLSLLMREIFDMKKDIKIIGEKHENNRKKAKKDH